jgi:aldehyde dehydrogenase
MNHADMQFLTTGFPCKKQYANFIGGEWVAPVGGEYFDNISPITGEPFTSIPRSREADIELALDAAHRAKAARSRTSATERASILNRIADRMEANLQRIAVAETIDNGKPLRETMAADIPLAIDHFRYFAGASAHSRARSPRSITTRSRITSMSRSASSARSSRGIFRS